MTKVPLVEIFHSIQGEGRHVGLPMTFVRVATCPLRCSYCDTQNSYTAPASASVVAGAERLSETNPVAVDRVLELVRQVARAAGEPHPQIVSLTGGEPLVFPAFVGDFGRQLRAAGGRLHLETAAFDADALAACIGGVDHLSADYKLPETLLPKAPRPGSFESEHVGCVAVAVEAGVTVDVKVVLTADATDDSFAAALAALAPFADRIELILQPVTPVDQAQQPLPMGRMAEFSRRARVAGFVTRVVPQLHKVLGIP